MRYLLVPLLPLVFAGCTEQQSTAPDIAAAPDFGATVTNELRYMHPARTTSVYTDEAQYEFGYLLGYDPADDPHCNDWQFVGGIPVKDHRLVSMEEAPYEFSDRIELLVTTVGRPPLYLYLQSDYPPSEAPADVWCAFLQEGYVASGHWSGVLLVTNDFAWWNNTPGTAVEGATEAGVLWGADGAMYKYEAKYALQPSEPFDRVLHRVNRVVRIK